MLLDRRSLGLEMLFISCTNQSTIWNEPQGREIRKISDVVIAQEFKQLEHDHSLFIKHAKNTFVVLIVSDDNIIIMSNNCDYVDDME